MKRTPLRPRSKPLKRNQKRIKAKGKSRFPKRRNAEYLAWIRQQPCIFGSLAAIGWIKPQETRTEAAHIRTRGAGGDDLWNVVPMCRDHHQEQEGRTREFETRYGIDLIALAADYTRRYHDETGRDIL